MRPVAQSLLSEQACNWAPAPPPPLELLHAGAAKATTAVTAKRNDTACRPAGTANRLLNVITALSPLSKSIPSKSGAGAGESLARAPA